jgi:hypothetical protein
MGSDIMLGIRNYHSHGGQRPIHINVCQCVDMKTDLYIANTGPPSNSWWINNTDFVEKVPMLHSSLCLREEITNFNSDGTYWRATNWSSTIVRTRRHQHLCTWWAHASPAHAQCCTCSVWLERIRTRAPIQGRTPAPKPTPTPAHTKAPIQGRTPAPIPTRNRDTRS